MKNNFNCYNADSNDCYCDNCTCDLVNGEPCTLESYNNDYCKCCSRRHGENFKGKYCNNCIHKDDTENIKTVKLTETMIKEREDIKLVRIERLAEINKKQYTFIRYEVRYADNKHITNIATKDEENAISLFDKIKN